MSGAADGLLMGAPATQLAADVAQRRCACEVSVIRSVSLGYTHTILNNSVSITAMSIVSHLGMRFTGCSVRTWSSAKDITEKSAGGREEVHMPRLTPS